MLLAAKILGRAKYPPMNSRQRRGDSLPGRFVVQSYIHKTQRSWQRVQDAISRNRARRGGRKGGREERNDTEEFLKNSRKHSAILERRATNFSLET